MVGLKTGGDSDPRNSRESSVMSRRQKSPSFCPLIRTVCWRLRLFDSNQCFVGGLVIVDRLELDRLHEADYKSGWE